MIINQEITKLLRQLKSEAKKITKYESMVNIDTGNEFYYKSINITIIAPQVFRLRLKIKYDIMTVKKVENMNILVVGDQEMDVSLHINGKLTGIAYIAEAIEKVRSAYTEIERIRIEKSVSDRLSEVINTVQTIKKHITDDYFE